MKEIKCKTSEILICLGLLWRLGRFPSSLDHSRKAHFWKDWHISVYLTCFCPISLHLYHEECNPPPLQCKPSPLIIPHYNATVRTPSQPYTLTLFRFGGLEPPRSMEFLTFFASCDRVLQEEEGAKKATHSFWRRQEVFTVWKVTRWPLLNFTSSALSFRFSGLAEQLVLTGKRQARSDRGKENLEKNWWGKGNPSASGIINHYVIKV